MLFAFLLLYSQLNAQDSDCSGDDSDQLPCKCTKKYHPTDCTCPEDPAELLGIPANNCPCLSTDDPRAGIHCPPFYCVAKDIPTDCVCDSNPNSQYPPITCQSENKCTSSSSEAVDSGWCTCTGSNHPTGCTCPEDLGELLGIPNNTCSCLSFGDPRAGNGECPAYCTEQDTSTSGCVCPLIVSDNATIPQDCIEQTKKCSNAQLQDLIGIPVSICSCLPAGDPRAGNLCPSYCTSKDTPTDCVCQSGTKGSYPKDKCEEDKRDPIQPYIDCPTKPTIDTPESECRCPIIRHSDEWNEDPRTAEGGICADSGLIKVIQTVVFVVIIIPILVLV
ncbi:MAG: hypothetical protein EZS28_029930 [Streblomastix strix]|uniref:Uncharacterized protein n=1 Tax=Streblomastix strix TaxID=222440 RepID=A0A5J4UWT2_9EUKA|nr:MAG: hypothetical protein EZS28_029930 [Streblomastix strix]